MFGRKNQPEDTEAQQDQVTISNLGEQIKSTMTPINLDNTDSKNQPETVQIVEKISAIVTPYFIAVVGLYLYDKNSLIGIILIAVGIVSLLKLPIKDLFNKAIKLLGLEGKI